MVATAPLETALLAIVAPPRKPLTPLLIAPSTLTGLKIAANALLNMSLETTLTLRTTTLTVLMISVFGKLMMLTGTLALTERLLVMLTPTRSALIWFGNGEVTPGSFGLLVEPAGAATGLKFFY